MVIVDPMFIFIPLFIFAMLQNEVITSKYYLRTAIKYIIMLIQLGVTNIEC